MFKETVSRLLTTVHHIPSGPRSVMSWSEATDDRDTLSELRTLPTRPPGSSSRGRSSKMSASAMGGSKSERRLLMEAKATISAAIAEVRLKQVISISSICTAWTPPTPLSIKLVEANPLHTRSSSRSRVHMFSYIATTSSDTISVTTAVNLPQLFQYSGVLLDESTRTYPGYRNTDTQNGRNTNIVGNTVCCVCVRVCVSVGHRPLYSGRHGCGRTSRGLHLPSAVLSLTVVRISFERFLPPAVRSP